MHTGRKLRSLVEDMDRLDELNKYLEMLRVQGFTLDKEEAVKDLTRVLNEIVLLKMRIGFKN